MDTEEIIGSMQEELDRLNEAIAALQGDGNGRRKGRRKRRTMSAEARERISLAQKKRWKQQKAGR